MRFTTLKIQVDIAKDVFTDHGLEELRAEFDNMKIDWESIIKKGLSAKFASKVTISEGVRETDLKTKVLPQVSTQDYPLCEAVDEHKMFCTGKLLPCERPLRELLYGNVTVGANEKFWVCSGCGRRVG